MEQNNEIYEQIDRYLLQQMSAEEQLAFEKELSQNPDLAREVQLRKDLAGGIRLNQNKKIKNQLNQIHEDVVQPKPNKSPLQLFFSSSSPPHPAPHYQASHQPTTTAYLPAASSVSCGHRCWGLRVHYGQIFSCHVNIAVSLI